MTFEGDPFRELGVAPGASLNEIKSAYRRLVKKYHPDAAGERALPRFLAIQAAYERLVDGEGHLRPAGGGPAPRPKGSGAGEPWRADPGRARASRDAWRARRSGSGGTAGYRPTGSSGGAAGGGTRPGAAPGSGTGPGSGPGSAGSGTRPGSTPGSGSSSGGAGSGAGSGSARPPGSGERHHRRGPRTATPGSTTYDEAAETPLDPEWAGGSWYGPSSGTYWTLNPREYADPRKHGPEYLARARRAAAEGRRRPGARPAGPVDPDDDPADDPADDTIDPADPTAADDAAARAGWQWTGTAHTRTEGGGTAWRARAWTYEAGTADDTSWTRGRERGRPFEPAPPPPHEAPLGRARAEATDDAPGFPDLETLLRRGFPENLLALARRPDRRWRLLLALVAWPPIGYAIGGLVSEATGCARYSATCPELVPAGLLVIQPLIVAALFLAPSVLAVAAFAALAALAIALPAGAVLSVGALPRPVIEHTVLGVIVATTYGIAFVAAVIRLWGPPHDGDRRADPGS